MSKRISGKKPKRKKIIKKKKGEKKKTSAEHFLEEQLGKLEEEAIWRSR